MTRPSRRRTGAGPLAAAALAALVLGGCTISTDRPSDRSGQDPASVARDRFERTQEVHLDLREPVTREEAGVLRGRPGAIIERAGADRFLDVELTLPGGVVLDVPAIGVVFANQVGEPVDAPVQNITINGVADDLAAARSAVERVVPVLGLDGRVVEDFFDGLRPGEAFGSNRVLVGPPIGYLMPEVEIMYKGPDRRVVINYYLSWDVPSGAGARHFWGPVDVRTSAARYSHYPEKV